jgi:hypothetical protein
VAGLEISVPHVASLHLDYPTRYPSLSLASSPVQVEAIADCNNNQALVRLSAQ